MLNLFNKEKLIKRRKKLAEIVGNGKIILMANDETPYNYPKNHYKFRQDSTFFYFTGINIPNLKLIIDLEKNKTILYGDDLTEEEIVWVGSQPKMTDLCEKSGIDEWKPLKEFINDVKIFITNKQNIHLLPPYRVEHKILLSELFGININNIKTIVSEKLIKAVIELRSYKDKEEIEYLNNIMDIAYEMHITAMKMAKSGIKEQEIYGKIEGIALSYGNGTSFQTILTKNGQILHNLSHKNILKKGDLLLCDAGFESEFYYCTDHTRTYAVDGEFSQKQIDIYNIVLQAQTEAINSVKPGILFKDVHLKACEVIIEGLKDLKLLIGETQEILNNGAYTLFFPHGLGHMLGLDVHDMENLGEEYVGYDEKVKRSDQFGLKFLRFAKELKPGYVLTIEPGIYFIPELINKFKKENKYKEFINYQKLEEYLDFGGIRLEDDILVEENGAKILGNKRIPIKIEEIIEIIKS